MQWYVPLEDVEHLERYQRAGGYHLSLIGDKLILFFKNRYRIVHKLAPGTSLHWVAGTRREDFMHMLKIKICQTTSELL